MLEPLETSDEFAKKLGAFIARLRSRLGYSQEGFALHCDLARSYMTLIEHGRVSISADKVRILASRLGLSLSQFYLLFDDPQALEAWEAQHPLKPKKPRRSRKLT